MPGRHTKKKKANGLTAKQRKLPKKLQQKILKSKARRKKR